MRQLYLNSCKKVGVIPVSLISRQIGGPEMVMRSHSLGPLGARAIAIALVDNKLVSSLDLEDNGLGPEGAICIGEMLEQNSFLTYLSLRENLIGTEGLRAICNGLKGNPTLQTLDLTGGVVLAAAIAVNDFVRILDVSWNHLRGNGAKAMGAALQKNIGLRRLRFIMEWLW
ncbi:hypothetical protein KUTeg_024831 [Tegillarca granosa]|uniref:Uncharacterized protein n=1 Tax=Tegillarca granosa TaxID=220873 RepID=A0ABQ9E452_TEGGR|nr:hypothetical protein KUTeg_024831 [Tegillarca granosa]